MTEQARIDKQFDVDKGLIAMFRFCGSSIQENEQLDKHYI